MTKKLFTCCHLWEFLFLCCNPAGTINPLNRKHTTITDYPYCNANPFPKPLPKNMINKTIERRPNLVLYSPKYNHEKPNQNTKSLP
jgi:hypothetical protein